MLQETENQEVQNLNLFDILERMCSAFSQASQEKFHVPVQCIQCLQSDILTQVWFFHLILH